MITTRLPDSKPVFSPLLVAMAVALVVLPSISVGHAEITTTSGGYSEDFNDIPSLPSGLTNAPLARLEVKSAGPYGAVVENCLEKIFAKAGRPRIGSGPNCRYTIVATVVEDPVLMPITPPSGSGGALGGLLGSAVGNLSWFSKNKKATEIVTNLASKLDYSNTNMEWRMSCQVALKLTDNFNDGQTLAHQDPHFSETNKVTATYLALSGIGLGSDPRKEMEKFFVQTISRPSPVARLATHYSALPFLADADKIFLSPPTAPVKVELPVQIATAATPVQVAQPSNSTPAPVQKVTKRGKFCSECGTAQTANAKYCSGCSARIED